MRPFVPSENGAEEPLEKDAQKVPVCHTHKATRRPCHSPASPPPKKCGEGKPPGIAKGLVRDPRNGGMDIEPASETICITSPRPDGAGSLRTVDAGSPRGTRCWPGCIRCKSTWPREIETDGSPTPASAGTRAWDPCRRVLDPRTGCARSSGRCKQSHPCWRMPVGRRPASSLLRREPRPRGPTQPLPRPAGAAWGRPAGRPPRDEIGCRANRSGGDRVDRTIEIRPCRTSGSCCSIAFRTGNPPIGAQVRRPKRWRPCACVRSRCCCWVEAEDKNGSPLHRPRVPPRPLPVRDGRRIDPGPDGAGSPAPRTWFGLRRRVGGVVQPSAVGLAVDDQLSGRIQGQTPFFLPGLLPDYPGIGTFPGPWFGRLLRGRVPGRRRGRDPSVPPRLRGGACLERSGVPGRIRRLVPQHQVLLVLEIHRHVELVRFVHGQEVQLVPVRVGMHAMLGVAREVQVRTVRGPVRSAGQGLCGGGVESPGLRVHPWILALSRVDAYLFQGDGGVLAQVEGGVPRSVLPGLSGVVVGGTRLSEGLYLPHHVLGVVQHGLLLPLVDDDDPVDQEGDDPKGERHLRVHDVLAALGDVHSQDHSLVQLFVSCMRRDPDGSQGCLFAQDVFGVEHCVSDGTGVPVRVWTFTSSSFASLGAGVSLPVLPRLRASDPLRVRCEPGAVRVRVGPLGGFCQARAWDVLPSGGRVGFPRVAFVLVPTSDGRVALLVRRALGRVFCFCPGLWVLRGTVPCFSDRARA
eukprot:scaffold846_cov336-Pavlova_lutheri.AAC.14